MHTAVGVGLIYRIIGHFDNITCTSKDKVSSCNDAELLNVMRYLLEIIPIAISTIDE